MSMRLTAALSSTVNRNRKRKRDLGSDVLRAAELEQDPNSESIPEPARSPSKRAENAKLEITNLIVAIEGEMSELSDITVGLRIVLSRMWEPIPERGTRLSREGLTELHRFRKTIPPIVMVSHLHSLFPSDPTFIDREIQRVTEDGLARRMVVNLNAGDMVIESSEYFRRLQETRNTDGSNPVTFDRFEALLRSKPTATRLSFKDLADASITDESGLRDLISGGFLVLSGSPGIYLISVPNVGSFLKLAFATRNWVVSLLAKTKWKESMEKMIHERWDANIKRWRDFRGVTFEWVVMECKGGGWCEPFGTPAGRGWRLTGKRE